jgi:uncharacterized protein with PQ loop repeat
MVDRICLVSYIPYRVLSVSKEEETVSDFDFKFSIPIIHPQFNNQKNHNPFKPQIITKSFGTIKSNVAIVLSSTFCMISDQTHHILSSMSEDEGTGVDFEYAVGFIDWAHCFPSVGVMWQVVGSIFFLIVFISFLPQTTELVTSRSSYGIESIAIFCQSLGHFLLVVNLLCFHSYDFVAFFQYPTMQAFPRIITFFNLFFQWILFLPTVYQLFIYHDREHRPEVSVRDDRAIRIEWYKTVGVGLFLTLLDASLVGGYLALSSEFSFETSAAQSYAEVCGTISTALEIGFFVPQMWTTCKLKDGGSLSLLMLEIQAPADLANSLYMWLGTHDHWTTWLTVLVNAGEEFTLLGTCLVFRFLAARRQREAQAAARDEKVFMASLSANSSQFDSRDDRSMESVRYERTDF